MNKKDSLRLFQQLYHVDVSWDDARLGDLEAVLGWDIRNWAIEELEEIKARQQIFAYLLEWLTDFDQLFAHWESAGSFTLPTGHSHQFLRYCSDLPTKNTEFWVWLEKKLLSNLPSDMPPRLKQAIEVIKREKDDYFQEEKDLAEAMLDDLTRSVVIEGILTLNISDPGSNSSRRFGWSEQVCCGVNLYLPAMEKIYEQYQAPKWLGFIGRYYAQWVNKQRKSQQQSGSQIETTPAPIGQDIERYFKNIFENSERFFSAFNHLSLKIYYCYDSNGLRVRVIDFDYTAGGFTTYDKRDVEPPNFQGLENVAKREAITGILIKACNLQGKNQKHADLRSGLRRYFHLQTISGENTSEHYRPMVFAQALHKYQAHLDLVNNWHQKVMTLFQELYGYYRVIKKIKNLAADYRLPLVMPEVSDQGNVLEISQFAPIRLGQKKSIQPFSQFSVNGKMLNLTGRNGSGKTTVLLAILDLCLMAQAGLPVFAQKAKLSIKKHFLLSFLERVADDSTFKAKLRKDMGVIAKIKNLDPKDRKNVLAIVDELGSATTQGSVMSVVKPFADWLSQVGISAILSTQIPELSQYMADQLGVKNFKITSGFALEEGIGEGEPDEVAKEMGFFDLLEK